MIGSSSSYNRARFVVVRSGLVFTVYIPAVCDDDNGQTEGRNIFGCLKIMVELFVLLEMENNSFSQFFVTLSLLSLSSQLMEFKIVIRGKQHL